MGRSQFTKEDIWMTDTWKDAQHHSPLGKYKSKPQWDTISHQWEWWKLTRQETANVNEDVEKEEPSCTVGGNVNWYSHSGKLWRFLKGLKIELRYNPAIALLGIYPKDTEAVKAFITLCEHILLFLTPKTCLQT